MPKKTKFKPSNYSVLVVDDEEFLREVIKECLTNEGYLVHMASTGELGQKTIEVVKPHLVISDVRLPKMSGLDLLKWSKEKSPIPFIMITGFSDLLESKTALDLGAEGFLPKPFHIEELSSLVKEVIQNKLHAKSPDLTVEEKSYFELKIEDFLYGSTVKYSIYIKLGESRYVKVAHSGEDLTPERIQIYKDKGVKFLYLAEKDFCDYVGLTASMSKAAVQMPGLSKEKKANLARISSEVMLEKLYFKEIKEEDFKATVDLVQTSIALACTNSNLGDLIDSMKETSFPLFTHSTAVSFVSVLIAKFLKWRSFPTITRLGLGAMLHDVGKKELNARIIEKVRRTLSPDEVKSLESHPDRGFKLMSSLRVVPDDVLKIIREHHENCVGSGYPIGLKELKIHPMARVVSLADTFVDLVLPKEGEVAVDATYAIKHIVAHDQDYFAVDALVALNEALGSPIPIKDFNTRTRANKLIVPQ